MVGKMLYLVFKLLLSSRTRIGTKRYPADPYNQTNSYRRRSEYRRMFMKWKTGNDY